MPVVGTEGKLKVDSLNPHCYDGTDDQLQQFLLLACVVAGKTAATQQKKLESFLVHVWREVPQATTCFQALQAIDDSLLLEYLVLVKMGQYNRLKLLIRALVTAEQNNYLNLRTCSAQDLEAFKGLGPKTARFFLLYTRRDIRVAVLDTHILRWMQDNQQKLLLPPGHSIPKSTPSGKRYAELETAFLGYCESNNLKLSDFDFELWKKGSQK